MQTPETPGMRRWTGGKEHHYFIRWAQQVTGGYYRTLDGKIYNVPDTKRFILGQEILISSEEGRYQQVAAIEFKAEDALAVLDQIAAFHGMPTYTAQLQRWALIEDVLDSMEASGLSGLYGKADVIKKIRNVLKETK